MEPTNETEVCTVEERAFLDALYEDFNKWYEFEDDDSNLSLYIDEDRSDRVTELLEKLLYQQRPQ